LIVRKESILNSTKKALIAAAVAVIFAAGLIFWQVKARKVGPIELTAEDMTRIAEEQPPQFRQRLAEELGLQLQRRDVGLDAALLLGARDERLERELELGPRELEARWLKR